MAIAPQAGSFDENRQRLLAYALLESAVDVTLELEYVMVPPVVKALIGAPGFDAQELQTLHEAMGTYHRFQGQHVSRLWRDFNEKVIITIPRVYIQDEHLYRGIDSRR